jgi:hypothetical protein
MRRYRIMARAPAGASRYFTVNVALRVEPPAAVSVSVYLPATRFFPFCLRASSNERVPALAFCDPRATVVLAHALAPVQRMTYVIDASALSE